MNVDKHIQCLKEDVREFASKLLGRLFTGSEEERNRKLDILNSSLRAGPYRTVAQYNNSVNTYTNARQAVLKNLISSEEIGDDFHIVHPREHLDSGLIDERALIDSARKGKKEIAVLPTGHKTHPGGVRVTFKVKNIGKFKEKPFNPADYGAPHLHATPEEHSSKMRAKYKEEETLKFKKALPDTLPGIDSPLSKENMKEISRRVDDRLNLEYAEIDRLSDKHKEKEQKRKIRHEKQAKQNLHDHAQRIISHIEQFGAGNRARRVEVRGKLKTKVGSPDRQHELLKGSHDRLELHKKYLEMRTSSLRNPEEEKIRRIGDMLGGALAPSYTMHDTDPIARKIGHHIGKRLDYFGKAFSQDLGPRSEPSAPAEDIPSEHAPR